MSQSHQTEQLAARRSLDGFAGLLVVGISQNHFQVDAVGFHWKQQVTLCQLLRNQTQRVWVEIEVLQIDRWAKVVVL